MASAFKIEEPAAGPPSNVVPAIRFERHVAEFQEFFKARGVSFGAVRDLPPFSERLRSDAGFAADIGSMLRTVIYRERDGFSRLELIELLTSAAGGPHADDAETPEIRTAVGQLMQFVEGVFRARWNPGAAASHGPSAVVPASAVEANTAESSTAEPSTDPLPGTIEPDPAPAASESLHTAKPIQPPPQAAAPAVSSIQSDRIDTVPSTAAPHAMTDLFYRARMVADSEAGDASSPERAKLVLEPEPEMLEAPTPAPTSAGRSKLVLEPEPSESAPIIASSKATNDADPVLHHKADLESRSDDDPLLFSHWQPAKPRRRFRGWLWVGAVLALLLAFCAGLLVHQRLLIPLRALGQPYQAPPPSDAAPFTGQSHPPAALTGNPQDDSTGTTGQPRTESLRSRRNTTPDGFIEKRETSPRGERTRPQASTTADPIHLLPSYMAPATVGASSGMMQSHLDYAPPAEYPALARMTHIEGKVLVEAVVGKSGQVIRAQAISGHRLLRGAAVREVYNRRYRPYLLNSHPTDVATIVTVDFQLGHETP